MSAPRARPLSNHLKLATMVLALSQVRASCVYSPPPVLSHGQGADTLGPGGMAAGAEVGWGAAGSWWKAKNLGDPEVNTGMLGVGRVRMNLTENLDAGLVGGLGPERTFVVGPEAKWRFARLSPGIVGGEQPGFHAALVSGMAFGAADYRYGGNRCTAGSPPGSCDDSPPRHVFLAPYAGILASGGIRVVQMFTGLRVAASETLGNNRPDLTLYPVLAFGVQIRPDPAFGFYAEGDLAGGITTTDIHDTGLLGSVNAGLSFAFDAPWARAQPR